jgi:succinate dehydrogenase / fumarate reductase, membrane anchor subunit
MTDEKKPAYTHTQPTIRTPLGAARGLGSAKEGAHHWWMQRVSAIALVPLSLYWLSYLPNMTTANYADFLGWIGSPGTAIVAILFVVASFYHAALGIQVIVEDYITSEGAKITTLLLNKFIFFALAAACIFSIASISFTHGHATP